MTRLLFKKCVGESLLLFLACAGMLFVFCWARVWIVCQFDLEQFQPLLKQFKSFERFSPVPLEQFLTYAGSIAMQFHEPVLILCIVVWSVARGSDVVSGELGRGTLEMLLAQPISRTRLLCVHSIVCVLGLAILCVTVWLGTAVGIHTNSVKKTVTPSMELKVPFLPIQLPIPIGETVELESPLASEVPPELFITPTLNLFGFGFFVLALSTLCSCFDRYRWRTIGIVLSIYVIQLLMFVLSRATDFTGWVGYLTFFSLFQPESMVQLVRNAPDAAMDIVSSTSVPGWEYFLGPFGMTLLLVGFGIIFYLIAWRRFKHRDLPAPL